MIKIFYRVLFPALLILHSAIFADCYAGPLSSAELINNAKKYDGNTITYKGEVVGDIMARGAHAWINLNDGKNAIGVWIEKGLIKDVKYTGSYKANGDLLEITGKFNRSCLEHGGDLDIHAWSVTKIGPGGDVSHALNPGAINFASILFFIILSVLLIKLLTKKL